MKRLFMSVCVLIFVAGGALAAESITPGYSIPVVLKKTLNIRKLKVGDAIEAETTDNVLGVAGTVLPKGARLTGTVVLCELHDRKGKQPARLSLQFTKAAWKGGSADLNGAIAGHVDVPLANENLDPDYSVEAGNWNTQISRGMAPFDGNIVPDPKLGSLLISHHGDIELPRGTTFLVYTRQAE